MTIHHFFLYTDCLLELLVPSSEWAKDPGVTKTITHSDNYPICCKIANITVTTEIVNEKCLGFLKTHASSKRNCTCVLIDMYEYCLENICLQCIYMCTS